MNDSLSVSEIRTTAELAALDLDDEAFAALARALTTLLDHFAIIASVELPAALPGAPVERMIDLAATRGDEVRAVDPGPLQAAAPDFEEDFFFVPRVLA